MEVMLLRIHGSVASTGYLTHPLQWSILQQDAETLGAIALRINGQGEREGSVHKCFVQMHEGLASIPKTHINSWPWSHIPKSLC